MYKALAFAVAVALLSACASARVTPSSSDALPFATIDDLPKDGDYSLGECPDGTQVAKGHWGEDNRYSMMMSQRRFMMIDFQTNTVWIGVLEGKSFRAEQRLSLEAAKAKYPSPCQYLAPGVSI